MEEPLGLGAPVPHVENTPCIATSVVSAHLTWSRFTETNRKLESGQAARSRSVRNQSRRVMRPQTGTAEGGRGLEALRVSGGGLGAKPAAGSPSLQTVSRPTGRTLPDVPPQWVSLAVTSRLPGLKDS